MAPVAGIVRSEFQSSPDPKAGRNASGDGTLTRESQFQSSPDPKAGRNVGQPGARIVATTFQSSPDPKAGRNEWRNVVGVDASTFQSSPDPKAGRNSRSASAPATTRSSFNPRPTRRPGAALPTMCVGGSRRAYPTSVVRVTPRTPSISPSAGRPTA